MAAGNILLGQLTNSNSSYKLINLIVKAATRCGGIALLILKQKQR